MIIVFTSDFAYPTVKDRLPVILARAVDTVYRMKQEIREKFGEVFETVLSMTCIIPGVWGKHSEF